MAQSLLVLSRYKNLESVMGNWEDDIFYENEEMPEENIKMFEEAVAKNLSGEELFSMSE